MLKLKMMPGDDAVAGRRRIAHQHRQSVREATMPPAWIMQPPPDWQDTAERDYFTLRERLITMQKQLEGTCVFINEQCR